MTNYVSINNTILRDIVRCFNSQYWSRFMHNTVGLVFDEKTHCLALDAVHEYCNNMHLTVNTQKTSHDIFSWKSKKISELYVWRLNIRRYL